MAKSLKSSTSSVPPVNLKRGQSAPKFSRPTSPLRSSDPSSDAKKSKKNEKERKEEVEKIRKLLQRQKEEEEEEEREEREQKQKYQDFVDEMLGIALYVDYKVKKLMEREIDHLRTMQEKLCCALLEKGKEKEELEMENKNLQKQLQEISMERDILRKKLEYEREYSRIILDIEK